MRLLKQKKGQSLVETAIVLPLVLLLLMAIVDFGFLFNNYIVISNASREAARKGALGATDTELNQVIQNSTTSLDSSRLQVTIYPAQSLRTSGTEMRITLQYENHLITPLVGSLLGDDITLKSQLSMRVE